ncbi:S-adenosyl-L-methionine-dependent methyltransferase [Xylogone sp. PMI_703]|nr:S-adenosyl-L-methionine-dependent methyltransferase [Xylogone sp. PMI_703]
MEVEPPLTELAAQISKYAQLVSDLKGPAELGVSANGSVPENKELEGARFALIEASRAMLEAAIGPVDRLRLEVPMTIQLNSALSVVTHYDIANHVPLEGEISFADLAPKVNLSLDRLQRVLRCVIAFRIFHEKTVGYVSHSATSKVLRDKGARAWMGHQFGEMLPASAKLVDSFEKYPDSENHDETAMSMAFYGPDRKTYWEILEKEPWKVQRFSDGLEYVTTTGGQDFHHVVRAYNWQKFGDATLVDVGGSSGRVSVAIAQLAPQLKFIIQDLPELEPVANVIIPKDLSNRMRFIPHDFFKPQPITDAKVYMYRQILHDWPDKEAIEILKALIPALHNGDVLLLVEAVIHEPNETPNGVDRLVRAADMLMMAKHNSKERTLAMWKKLLKDADSRFELVGVTSARDSPESGSVIEVKWNS